MPRLVYLDLDSFNGDTLRIESLAKIVRIKEVQNRVRNMRVQTHAISGDYSHSGVQIAFCPALAALEISAPKLAELVVEGPPPLLAFIQSNLTTERLSKHTDRGNSRA